MAFAAATTPSPEADARASCPDENALVGLIEGRLGLERETALEDHIDGCAGCSRMMTELAELLAPATVREEGGERVIGRYQVLDELGAGGMGVVYAAFDPELRRKVALKLLRPDIGHFTDSQAARARLLREARLLATLSHPNVVTVYDVGAADEDIYIAVELVEGRSLALWQAEHRPSWREVAEVYVQAARGLLAAHQAGLVHRDVKPANLLLGDDGRVRVTDFGLATMTESEPNTTSGVARAGNDDTSLVTQAGAVVGTPAFMAPEQYAGRGADARSDQFSFCVSLAEAFTGERPTAGATRDDLLEAAAAHRREAPPGALLEVVARGLAARPVDRHDDMAAVARVLERALGGDEEPLVPALDVRARTEPPPARVASEAASHPSSARYGWWVALGLAGAVAYLALSQTGASVVERDAAVSSAPRFTAEPVRAPGPDAPPDALLDDLIPSEREPEPPGIVVKTPATPIGSAPPAGTASRDVADKAFLDARRHHDVGEGSACLAALDRGAQHDPQRGATGFYQRMRAQCLMMGGDCAGGRAHLRKLMGGAFTGSALEAALDAQSIAACRAKAATPLGSPAFEAKRDEVQALLQKALDAQAAGDVAQCRAVGAEIQAYAAKHNIATEPLLKQTLHGAHAAITDCLAKNLDCAAARKSFETKYRTLFPELMTPAEYDQQIGPMFESAFPQCKGK